MCQGRSCMPYAHHAMSVCVFIFLVRSCPRPALQDEYESPRRAANSAMMGALDAVRSAFRHDDALGGAWPVLRGAGLSLLNAAGPAKNRIMRFAMGM